MKFCSNCGQKVNESDKFCQNCGFQVSQSKIGGSNNIDCEQNQLLLGTRVIKVMKILAWIKIIFGAFMIFIFLLSLLADLSGWIGFGLSILTFGGVVSSGCDELKQIERILKYKYIIDMGICKIEDIALQMGSSEKNETTETSENMVENNTTNKTEEVQSSESESTAKVRIKHEDVVRELYSFINENIFINIYLDGMTEEVKFL